MSDYDESIGPSTIEQCIVWLDRKYKRHGEIEDKESADYLRALAKERDELRAENRRLQECAVGPLTHERDSLQRQLAKQRERSEGWKSGAAAYRTERDDARRQLAELRESLIKARKIVTGIGPSDSHLVLASTVENVKQVLAAYRSAK